MTAYASASNLQIRMFRLDPAAELPPGSAWYDGQPLPTHLLNAYTALIPEGERFVIRSCSHYLDRAAPELRDELKRLFHQEGQHAREHQRVLDALHGQGLSLVGLRKLIGWVGYRFLEPLTPHKLRLATAAAIEHHNAAIATYFLEQGLVRGARNRELRRLFLWHFSEEIEHKETVFKLLQSVSRSWSLRALGLTFSFATFIACLGLGTLLLAVKADSRRAPGFWKSLRHGCARTGLIAAIARQSMRYLRPSFRPSAAESRALLDSALAELECLGIEQSRARQSSRALPLPDAFRDRMAPGLERVRRLKPGNPFFSASIAGYDGAWVHSQEARKLNFCTYSYLGLLGHPRIEAAAKAAIARYGTGTHGVRLLGGNLDLHEKLEAEIAAFHAREAAITFSSGFMTNLAVIAALVGRGDYVLSDQRNHASIVDGCRFSGAEVTTFAHNDMLMLEQRLQRMPAGARKLMVVDAVYSMDGDIAPLEALLALRDRYPNTLLMVDEAHSLGVLGNRGRGIEEEFDCVGKIDVLMGTLSKTIPAQGGYIAGSRELITFLRFNARGFVFSAALSPASAAAALVGLQLIEKEGRMRRAKLLANVTEFVSRLRAADFDVGNSASAIVPIILGSEPLAFEMARRCNVHGLYAMPVAYPAVAHGAERLRLNVTYDHCRKDLEFAVDVLRRARTAIKEAAGRLVRLGPFLI